MKTGNKRNVVRLTESKLKSIIAEEVMNTLNEIGETPYGQYMLGRVAARQDKYPDDYKGVWASQYAMNKRVDNNMSSNASSPYFKGNRSQHNYMKDVDNYQQYGPGYNNNNKREMDADREDIQQDAENYAYQSLPSYRKEVDDKNYAKNNAMRHQVRNRYKLNNTNESRILHRIVSESIDRILRNNR